VWDHDGFPIRLFLPWHRLLEVVPLASAVVVNRLLYRLGSAARVGSIPIARSDFRQRLPMSARLFSSVIDSRISLGREL
jgi:hypothetical protein